MSHTDSMTAIATEFPWEVYPDAVNFDEQDAHTTYTFITETSDDADRLVDMCARFASLQSSPIYIWSWLLPSSFAVSLCIHDDRGVSSHEALSKLMDPPMKLAFIVRKFEHESTSLLRVYGSPDIEDDILHRFPSVEDYKCIRSAADLLLIEKNEFNTKSRVSLQSYVSNRFGHNLPFVLSEDTCGIEVHSQRQSFSFDGLSSNDIAPSYAIKTPDSDSGSDSESTYLQTPSNISEPSETSQSAD